MLLVGFQLRTSWILYRTESVTWLEQARNETDEISNREMVADGLTDSYLNRTQWGSIRGMGVQLRASPLDGSEFSFTLRPLYSRRKCVDVWQTGIVHEVHSLLGCTTIDLRTRQYIPEDWALYSQSWELEITFICSVSLPSQLLLMPFLTGTEYKCWTGRRTWTFHHFSLKFRNSFPILTKPGERNDVFQDSSSVRASAETVATWHTLHSPYRNFYQL